MAAVDIMAVIDTAVSKKRHKEKCIQKFTYLLLADHHKSHHRRRSHSRSRSYRSSHDRYSRSRSRSRY